MPESSKWFTVRAMTHESAYSGLVFWFKNDKRIAVVDSETKIMKVFTREHGKSAEYVEIEPV